MKAILIYMAEIKKWLRMKVEWDYSYYRNIFEGELAIFRKDVA